MRSITRREWFGTAASVAAQGAAATSARPRVEIGSAVYRCERPARVRGKREEYKFEGVTLEYEATPLPGGGLKQQVVIDAPANARLVVPNPAPGATARLPLRTGVLGRGGEAGYELAGSHGLGEAPLLAIPMVDFEGAEGSPHHACSADPDYSTGFRPGEFHWVHTLGGRAARTFYTVPHRGGFREAMDAFYRSALAGVKPGPDWLHDVAMVDYDYLSKNGKGWFADIDRLCELVPKSDRHRIVMTLHGWYDYVGRYSFDHRARALDRKWIAFPNVDAPEFVEHARRSLASTSKYSGWRRVFGKMRPTEMTIEDVHRRIRYARDRSFRCVLYFADGMTSGEGVRGVHDPSKVLSWGAWVGPETAGKTYVQNPLHPEVRAFFKDYHAALLHEYGKEIDGLVWDETFTVKLGMVGKAPGAGYAEAGMMSMVRELREATERYSPHIAFLSSDDVSKDYKTPYALVSHGTYQDSACLPHFWPYGLFPNFRNTLWSCNWFPDTGWENNERAVDPFGAPVGISNGYGDDLGVSNMNEAQVKRTLALFRKRSARRTRIGWIEEKDGRYTYNGVEIPKP